MVSFKCPGCPATFHNNRSYGNHKQKCKSKINVAAAARLELRKQNVQKIQEKRREAALEILPEVQEQDFEMRAEYDDPVCGVPFLFAPKRFYLHF